MKLAELTAPHKALAKAAGLDLDALTESQRQELEGAFNLQAVIAAFAQFALDHNKIALLLALLAAFQGK